MKPLKNRVVALGVLYHGIENYLDDYFTSLQNQSYMDFDIWILNDGLDKELLQRYATKHKALNIYEHELEGNYTPAQIREIAIKGIKDKYNYLIFTDADDYFSSNRIEKSIRVLQNYDFCYNDMILVNDKGKRLSDTTYFAKKNNPKIINSFNQLVNKNFCGLSNTAINLKTINLDFLLIPQNLIAVDWWIFSLLSMKGYKGYYLDDAYTYYRQHESNTVGGLCNTNEKHLLRGLHVKKEQYKLLLKYYPSNLDSIINKELNDILALEKKLKERTYLEKYIANINNEDKEFMWWENIQL